MKSEKNKTRMADFEKECQNQLNPGSGPINSWRPKIRIPALHVKRGETIQEYKALKVTVSPEPSQAIAAEQVPTIESDTSVDKRDDKRAGLGRKAKHATQTCDR